MSSPTLSPQHRDLSLVSAADKSGWTGEEVAFALLHLCLGHLKAQRTKLAISEATHLLTIAAERP